MKADAEFPCLNSARAHTHTHTHTHTNTHTHTHTLTHTHTHTRTHTHTHTLTHTHTHTHTHTSKAWRPLAVWTPLLALSLLTLRQQPLLLLVSSLWHLQLNALQVPLPLQMHSHLPLVSLALGAGTKEDYACVLSFNGE